MKMHMKMRVATLAVSVALLGGTALVASGQTGAYFSDSLAGSVAGTIGQVVVTTPNSTPWVNFTNLLPGDPQSVTVGYRNDGTVNEDIWINFNNLTALSALNNLGHFGSFTVTGNGPGTIAGPAFTSSNLDDNSAADACGPLSPSGCWPVPQQIKIASNITPGQAGSFTITFEYASALGNTTNTTWNPYPLPGDNGMTQTYAACETYYGSHALPAGDASPHAACSNNQVTINPSDTGTSGLPYQLVGTQVGITPGQAGTKF